MALSIFDAVGYTVHREAPLPPLIQPYGYVMAGNGLFVRAANDFVTVCWCIAPAEVRGLSPLDNTLTLKHPRLPAQTLLDIINDARQFPELEVLYQTLYQSSPEQQPGLTGWRFITYRAALGTACSIDYEDMPGPLLLDTHSHHTMAAFFSNIDDAYHTAMRWYAVIGRIHDQPPHVLLRLSVYGHFILTPLTALFDIGPMSVTDAFLSASCQAAMDSYANR